MRTRYSTSKNNNPCYLNTHLTANMPMNMYARRITPRNIKHNNNSDTHDRIDIKSTSNRVRNSTRDNHSFGWVVLRVR